MIVQAFIIISLMGFIGWREFSIVSLRKSIDRVSEALWLLRLTLIEKGAKERNEHDELR